MHQRSITAEEALERLKRGNSEYINGIYSGNISKERRIDVAENGQHPYAVIVTCSDSRVVPEIIFNAGIGDLFVIRSAGNIVDGCTLGSIEYAVEHLGCNLAVVLGHTNCGAVAGAIECNDGGHHLDNIDYIVKVIGDEKDPLVASKMNVMHSVSLLKQDIGERMGVEIIGAIYDISNGSVIFDIPIV